MSEPAGLPRPVPIAPATERVRLAYLRRADSDYIFHFWTAFGWIMLTLGIYFIYVVYQLVRRDRDHNQRRLELLESANALAWERAQAQGLADELEPHFVRVSNHLEPMRLSARQSHEPAVWAVGAAFTYGVAGVVAFIFCDHDLVRHAYEEGGAENELAYIYTRLGTPIVAPDPARLRQPHNYVGRTVVTVVTAGIYSFFWLNDVMRDGNEHFEANWVWEDSLAQAVQAGEAA